jgi:hypothetical protein
MVSLSPLMSDFGTLLDGLTTVRGKSQKVANMLSVLLTENSIYGASTLSRWRHCNNGLFPKDGSLLLELTSLVDHPIRDFVGSHVFGVDLTSTLPRCFSWSHSFHVDRRLKLYVLFRSKASS